MQPTRRQKIEALLRDSPDDVFLRYSLALEMENDGDWEAGIDILQDLARATPSYVPAYHMAGRHLAKHGRIAEARARSCRMSMPASQSPSFSISRARL